MCIPGHHLHVCYRILRVPNRRELWAAGGSQNLWNSRVRLSPWPERHTYVMVNHPTAGREVTVPFKHQKDFSSSVNMNTLKLRSLLLELTNVNVLCFLRRSYGVAQDQDILKKKLSLVIRTII